MSTKLGFVHVVDDDDSFRRSVARLLSEVGYKVASFPSAADFLAQHTSVSRGCVLADLHMPGCSGLELQVQLAASGNPLPMVFLSGNGTIPSTVKAMRQGAVDFLTKCAPDSELLAAVAQAVQLDDAQHARLRTLEVMQNLYHQLSAREREVFAVVITGDLNKQIADDLGIALRTVKLHRTNISRKLRMSSVPEWIQLWNTIRNRES
jgi:two-component system response regulator FixJ